MASLFLRVASEAYARNLGGPLRKHSIVLMKNYVNHGSVNVMVLCPVKYEIGYDMRD